MFVLPAGSEAEKPRSARAQRDLLLVAQALAGDAQGYQKLLAIHRRSVYYMILMIVHHAEETEDLTMEAFAKAFRFLPRYQPCFAFSTWLFRIATNLAIDFSRRKRLLTQSLNTETELGDGGIFHLEIPDQGPNPQEVYMRQQRVELVQWAVARLPAKYLRLVQLRYFDELSCEEVAVALEIPLGTVKAQLFRARELLMALLKDRQAAF